MTRSNYSNIKLQTLSNNKMEARGAGRARGRGRGRGLGRGLPVHHDSEGPEHNLLVQHFINLSVEFEEYMNDHPNKIIHNVNPAPVYPGFEEVPDGFKPAVYKMLNSALNPINFTLQRVVAPEFGYICDIPDILAMRNDINILQGQVNILQGQVNILQGDVHQIAINVQLLINHAGIQNKNQ
mmetsp:Transcript_16708/g.15068  ORF Transcript_16708/g.15068 Transcript_16708/m.15068 type:complete len:182 (+) Transcript_16708:21-566(+)